MALSIEFAPLTLHDGEQVVHAAQARRWPDPILLIFSLFYLKILLTFLLAQSIHRLFRPQIYMITTQRVLIAEPEGIIAEMPLSEITKTRGSRRRLMIYGTQGRIWMNRQEDGWRFRDTLHNTLNRLVRVQ